MIQLRDAESSRGSPINYFRTGAGDRLVIVTVKRGEGQKNCSKNLCTSFMDGPRGEENREQGGEEEEEDTRKRAAAAVILGSRGRSRGAIPFGFVHVM